MEITETKVSRVEKDTGKLKGFASITFDNVFVVRGIRIINGKDGLFIAMPNRKTEFRCPGCNAWNVFHSHYCTHCGKELPESSRNSHQETERSKKYQDIAHPITNEFREYIQKKVMEAYHHKEQEEGGTGSEKTEAGKAEND